MILYLWPMRQYALAYGLVYPADIEFSVSALVLSVPKC